MIRKILIGVAIPVAAGVFFFGTDAYSYLTTSARKVRGGVKSNVPVEFEIERLKSMVADLIPDIQKNMHVIAQEEVEVETLGDQIGRAEKNLAVERVKIMELRGDLDNSHGKFRFGSRRASGSEVRGELHRRFVRYKDAVAAAEARRRIQQAREKSLVSTREKLDGMLSAKRDLQVQVHNLEARLKMLQALQTTSQCQFDDSRLVRCKKLVRELRKRLDVAERMMEQEGRLLEWVTIDSEVPEDLDERIDEYFETNSPPAAAQRAI